MQVLDVMAERGKLSGTGEELEQPGQVTADRARAERVSRRCQLSSGACLPQYARIR